MLYLSRERDRHENRSRSQPPERRETKAILASLGAMYADGGEFTKNIDAAGGEGTAQFAADAIAIYCRR